MKSSYRFNLTKGESCPVPSRMRRVVVGCGWDPDTTRSSFAFDLDVACLCLDARGKYASMANFVYFNNKNFDGEVIVHTGDNLTGDGEGDDERLIIDLANLPSNVARIDILCTIFEAKKRGQCFGMISNCFMRIVDVTSERNTSLDGPLYQNESLQDTEFCRFAINDDATTADGVMFGSLVRDPANGQWKFIAVQKEIYGGFQGVLDQCYDEKSQAGSRPLLALTTRGSSTLSGTIALMSQNQPLALMVQTVKENKVSLLCLGAFLCLSTVGLFPIIAVGCLYAFLRAVLQ